MKTLIFDLDGTLAYLGPVPTVIADAAQIRALASVYRLALVSGSPRQEIIETLAYMGLTDYFPAEYIVANEDSDGDKASGAPFLEIKKRVQGPMIMVGDSDSDEQGTTVAGIPFIRVPRADSIQEQRQALIDAIQKARRLLDT